MLGTNDEVPKYPNNDEARMTNALYFRAWVFRH